MRCCWGAPDAVPGVILLVAVDGGTGVVTDGRGSSIAGLEEASGIGGAEVGGGGKEDVCVALKLSPAVGREPAVDEGAGSVEPEIVLVKELSADARAVGMVAVVIVERSED